MVRKEDLYKWCSVPAKDLETHPDLVIRFRMVKDSCEMGRMMAKELADEIALAGREGREFRAIIPCGPKCWYEPFAEYVNRNRIDMKHVTVFHMDECLDWQGNLLAEDDPYNFRTFMLREFYGPIHPDLNIPAANRNFLNPQNMYEIKEKIAEAPVDYTLGGWGQDGHIAYNQSRRHPFSQITIEELRESGIRIQENNLDTIITLGHRSYGAAYQFVPPMSITLGIRECLSAKKVRIYSDTGSWKQTALRVALFSGEDSEYPMTLLQGHKDALITATYETADHPISRHPEWKFAGVNI